MFGLDRLYITNLKKKASKESIDYFFRNNDSFKRYLVQKFFDDWLKNDVKIPNEEISQIYHDITHQSTVKQDINEISPVPYLRNSPKQKAKNTIGFKNLPGCIVSKIYF